MPEQIVFNEKQLLISNYEIDDEQSIDSIILRPYEARVYSLK